MLIGFAFVLIGLIVQSDNDFGQPNVALVLLVSAALLLVNAVQLTFRARQYYVPPDEFTSLLEIAKADGFTEETVKCWYKQWLRRHKRYLSQARLLYNGGVALLLVAVAVALIPPGPISKANHVRLAAVFVVVIGATLEAIRIIIPPIKLCIRKLRDADQQRPPPKWPEAVAEAMIMLLVLGLMAAAGLVGWVIGHFTHL
ncbi:MAG TPA: hypothetical protein VE596_09740 [Gaiellaceae bacterium]|jgi:hypothetical protein|nr:hypothetical protein [Gaiellaceae bacterium]